MGRGRKLGMILVLSALAWVMVGCRKQEARQRQEMDFTVCAETELPDDLRQIIEEKKLHAFQISYTTKEHLYIAVGYGEHDRTNLCVVVEELYKTDRAIYIKTDLRTESGDEDGENANTGMDVTQQNNATATDSAGRRAQAGTSSMYPYIVIRLPRIALPVLSVS